MPNQWKSYNPTGNQRILVTKMLPGDQWLDELATAGYQVEVYTSTALITKNVLIEQMGTNCAGVIGQLTEDWDEDLFEVLRKAGGRVYCNYAVGYDNVQVEAATRDSGSKHAGGLTETTAEMAVALMLACARHLVEADTYTREGRYTGWQPGLFLGQRLNGQTVGIVVAGRIDSAYAGMMATGFNMNLMYFSRSKNEKLEQEVTRMNNSLTAEQAESLEELLQEADVVSLYTPLNEDTHHLIGAGQLSGMKENAILINTSRGPVIDEAALAEHCRRHTHFNAGLDVFEQEPLVHEALKGLPNMILTPHVGSATRWTREAMALLAALNVKGVLEAYPVWDGEEITDFLEQQPPEAIPSIVNASFI